MRSKINFLVGPQELLLATVKRQQLAWFGDVTRYNILSKTISRGNYKGGRRRGWQRQYWMNNIKEWNLCPYQNCLQWPPAEKTGQGSLPNRPPCPADDTIGQGIELN